MRVHLRLPCSLHPISVDGERLAGMGLTDLHYTIYVQLQGAHYSLFGSQNDVTTRDFTT